MTAADVAELFRGRTLHRRAHLWKITRADGTVLRFAEWDREISFDGEVYTPAGGLVGTADDQERGLDARSLEVHGLISSSAITEDDLWRGLYRMAAVEHFEVDARYPWNGYIEKNTFRIARTFFDGSQWGAEIQGLGSRLSKRRGLVAERHCSREFGGFGCGYDIPGSGLVRSYTVTTVPEDRVEIKVINPGGTTPGTDDYRNGRIRFTSGLNAGVEVDVAAFSVALGLDTICTWDLEVPVPHPIQPGDTFEATPGCDRTWTDCIGWHGNGVSGAADRWGGFRTIPGTDESHRER